MLGVLTWFPFKHPMVSNLWSSVNKKRIFGNFFPLFFLQDIGIDPDKAAAAAPAAKDLINDLLFCFFIHPAKL
jgi:hypothetical protein